MRNATGWVVPWVAVLALSTGTLSAQERWVYRYVGAGGPAKDSASSVVVGPDSNVYAAGYSEGAGWDFTVISLTPVGGERWVYLHNGAGSGSDEARSIVIGTDGNVYAAGGSFGGATAGDFAVISLTPSGGERWVYRYNGPANDYDMANSIVAGADGNLYAAGYSEGIGTGLDFTVVSLDTSGGERWVYRYDGPENGRDEAHSIVMGADTNLYAAGYSRGIGTYRDFTVISVTAQGGERWVYRYSGSGDPSQDVANSIVAGTDGNLYVAGVVIESGTGSTFTVVSLTPSGGERWIYKYSGPASRHGQAYSIVMGADGNLYAAGYSGEHATLVDFTVISLDTSGGERWVNRYNGPADSWDWAVSIVVGTDGNLHAAGYSYGSGTLSDFTVVSLIPSGGERWVYSYNGPANGLDGAGSIAAGTHGNLYAAGSSEGSGTWLDFTVVNLRSDLHNVGTASVDEPPDTVACGDTVLVAATVCNYGDSVETFDVEATIDSSGTMVYADTQSVVDLDISACDTVGFMAWIVPSVHQVSYTVTVTTLLPTDTIFTNDTAAKATLAWCPAHDVGAEVILSPPNVTICGDTVAVTATVCNYGDVAETFDVEAMIDSSGVGVYADTERVVDLASGDCDTVRFLDWVVPSVDNVFYTVAVTTMLPGDGDSTNDRASKVLLIRCPVHDAGTVSIISPPDTVPCGLDTMPRARVCNYGNRLESFDVACYFDSSGNVVYGDTVGVDSLLPGDTAAVDFSSWTACATHDVTYLMTVTTLLGDDSDPANDSLQRTVTTWCPGVEEIVTASLVPSIYDLKQSRPNPTMGWTRIDYQLPAKSSVCLRVYDLKGTVVRTLVEGVEEAGFRTVVWNGKHDAGGRVPSGVYFYRLTTGDQSITKKMVLLE